jgi:cellulose synthase operon protein C
MTPRDHAEKDDLMARRKLNKNVVIGLTLFTFLMMVVLATIMISQLQRGDPKYFVELAEEAKRAQQWEQAARFYGAAWQRSNDAEYLVELGSMWLNHGDVGRASTTWQQALVHQPNLIKAHISRLELLLELAQLNGRRADWDEIRRAADRLLNTDAEKSVAQRAFAHHARGLALIQLQTESPGNLQGGLVDLARAAELDPEQIDYPLELAKALIQNDRMEEGVQLLDELMQAHQTPGAAAARVRVVKAAHLLSQEEPERAESIFRESLELAGTDTEARNEARTAYAKFLKQQWSQARRDNENEMAESLFDRAEALLLDVIGADPDGYGAYQELAELYRAAERYDDVVALCDKRLKRGLVRRGIKATRNRLDAFRLMITASEARVAQALGEENTKRREELLQEAQRYVVDARGEFPTHPRVMSQSGKVNVARGRYRAALDDLRKADEAYRSFDTIDWENKIILAQVHLQLREAGAAKDVLEGVVQQAARQRVQNPVFWNTYSQALIETGALDRALAIVDRVLLLDPDNDDAARLKAAIFERQGKHVEAGKIIEEVTGDKAISAMLQARQLTLEHKSDQAVAVLKDALREAPDNTALVQALVNELFSQNQRAQAQRVIEEAQARNPDDQRLAALALLLRDDLSEEQRDEAILTELRKEPDAYKRSLDLVAFYLRKSEPAKTLEQLREAERHLTAKDTPLSEKATITQHRALLRAMVRLAVQVDDTQAMEYARNQAVRYDVDGAGGRSVVGLFHMARKEFELAINAFRGALNAQPTDTWTLVHLGQSLLLVGRLDEAEAAYNQALRINPNEPLAHRDLAMLAKQRGDDESYQEHLAVCERLAPNDPWVERELVARAEEADPATAILRRETRLSASPNDMENLKRLAYLSEKAGDRDRADRYYEKLIELAPTDRAIVASAADYFRTTDREERARSILDEHAKSQASAAEQANARILVAEHYIEMQENEQAERVLLDAAAKAETVEIAQRLGMFYLATLDEPGKAIPWLNIAVEKARQSSSPQLAQALITRIVCYLNREINELDAARRDVSELITRYPDDPRGLLWQSEVQARSGKLDAAIASLSDYLARRPGDPFALFQRAQHYLANGRSSAAIEDLEAIKRVDPLVLDLTPRILLANLYYRTGRRDRWIHELESLVQDAPDSQRSNEELVAAYIREGRARDADRLITAQLNRAGDRPDPRWLSLRARVSLEEGQYNKALEDLRRAAELRGYTPDSLVAVLDLFVFTERFADGVAYYEKHAGTDTGDPRLESRYALLLMLSGQQQKGVEQFRRAMALAIDTSPDMVRHVTSDLRRMLTDEAAARSAVALFRDVPTGGPLTRANDRILVRLFRRAEQSDEAIRVLDRLIASAIDDDERAALFAEKGEIHHLAGEHQRAREAYEESLKYDDHNWITLNNLAYLLSDAMGENKVALGYAQKAVAAVENPSALDTLGWIYVGLGQYSSAIAELGRAVRLDPNSALIHYHLGEAYRRNGQMAEANDVLQNGRNIARAADDEKYVALIEESIEKVDAADRSP